MTNLGVPFSVNFYTHNKRDYSKYPLGMNEHDCLTCSKHITGIIPNNIRCNTICGINKNKYPSQKVPKKYKMSKAEILRIQNTPNFMEQLTTPNNTDLK